MGERCSESWLQVNLILDGSSSPLKYLVNRFRSSTYPRSLQTFDSLCFARGHSRRLSAPRDSTYPSSSRSPYRRFPLIRPLFLLCSSLRIRSSFETKRKVIRCHRVSIQINTHSFASIQSRQVDRSAETIVTNKNRKIARRQIFRARARPQKTAQHSLSRGQRIAGSNSLSAVLD